jgi:hypothetical protein
MFSTPSSFGLYFPIGPSSATETVTPVSYPFAPFNSGKWSYFYSNTMSANGHYYDLKYGVRWSGCQAAALESATLYLHAGMRTVSVIGSVVVQARSSSAVELFPKQPSGQIDKALTYINGNDHYSNFYLRLQVEAPACQVDESADSAARKRADLAARCTSKSDCV